MDTLLSMKVFRQVVESGSFVAAAERIDLLTAMTSKHVMNLVLDDNDIGFFRAFSEEP